MNHWVIIMKPMGDEILVKGTRDDVAALRPRSMVSFPLADLIAGGWTHEDVKTPARVREDMRAIKGPYFEPIPVDEYEQALTFTDMMRGVR